jgi:hypothetical protein
MRDQGRDEESGKPRRSSPWSNQLNYIPEDIDSIAAGFSKDAQGRLIPLRQAAFTRFQLAKREGFLTIRHSDKRKERQKSSGLLHYLLWCFGANRPFIEVAISGKYSNISYNCDPTGIFYTCNPTDADLEYFRSLCVEKLVAEDANACLGRDHAGVWGIPNADAIPIARQIAAVMIARTKMTPEERDEYCHRCGLENCPPPPRMNYG